jgi:hypothetical protein
MVGETEMASPEGEPKPFVTQDDAKAQADHRREMVGKIIKDVKRWKAHHEAAFKRMKRDVAFVKNKDGAQWKGVDGVSGDRDAYVANITLRAIKHKVDSLYARNPKVRAKRRPMVDYVLWDGRPETLMTAQNTVMMGMQAMQAMAGSAVTGLPMPPMGAPPGPPGAPPMGHNGGPPMPMGPMMDPMTAMSIVQEAVQVRQRRDTIDRIGKTAEIMFQYYLDTSQPRFKTRMKQAVRRAATAKVAWIKMDFERAYDGFRPETTGRIADLQTRVKEAQRMLGDVEAGNTQAGSAEIEMLMQQLNQLQSEPDALVREGLVFDFPDAWDVIPDDECKNLVGLVGCQRLAHEFESTVSGIKRDFGIDLGKNYTAYESATPGRSSSLSGEPDDGTDCKVKYWEVYDSVAGMVYFVCDGYPDFLREPGPPRVEVQRFFPYYAIVLNEVENDGDLYPPSDVELIEHQQRELNRSREALRQHRIAAQPGHVTGKDKFSEDDINRLRNRAAHDVVQLQAMMATQKASDLIQPIPTSPIDPNLYQDAPIMQDFLRVTGAQDANLGPTSNSTATEAGIAESSRSQSVSSNIDDIDSVLSDLARDGTAVMLKEVSPEMAKRIAGVGAIWPQGDGADIAMEMVLEVVAGSSGKPNRAQETAAFERVAPIAMQIPGINPEWWARKSVQLIDEAADLDDALLDKVPSIIALNTMFKGPAGGGVTGNAGAQPTGDPRSDPMAQGGAGGMNMPMGMGVPGGPQAGMPAPGDGTGLPAGSFGA